MEAGTAAGAWGCRTAVCHRCHRGRSLPSWEARLRARLFSRFAILKQRNTDRHFQFTLCPSYLLPPSKQRQESAVSAYLLSGFFLTGRISDDLRRLMNGFPSSPQPPATFILLAKCTFLPTKITPKLSLSLVKFLFRDFLKYEIGFFLPFLPRLKPSCRSHSMQSLAGGQGRGLIHLIRGLLE